MGKLLKQQRRGKGNKSLAYRAPSHRYKAELAYRLVDKKETEEGYLAKIVEFIDDPARGALLMKVMLEDSTSEMLLAPEGAMLGSNIYYGSGPKLTLGSVLPLSRLPDGAYLYNLELSPGDGGKAVRTPGSHALIVSHEGSKVIVKLPSKHTVTLDAACRAQLGVVSGGGRLEMPLMKAGTNFYKKHAQNRKWPVNRGVHMSAYTHPFGGKQHHKGRSSSVARGAPPGRKVGHLASRSTGRGSGQRQKEKSS
ncbi:MAG TPA: 50S ribosomal protein L2 [Candidatus Micrarchaeota archaeon]|nr:50S ribosomal protein L2 [Candidatus Micrarchaeota archaeon]